MRICVGCGQHGQNEPAVFHLGSRRLPVVAILERWVDSNGAHFKVRVQDGRVFVLCREPASLHWALAAVYCAEAHLGVKRFTSLYEKIREAAARKRFPPARVRREDDRI